VPFQVKKAVAVLRGPDSNVHGVIYFAQADESGPVSVSGEIKNLDADAERGFHIHQFGDATDGCMSSGGHFNPEGNPHGSPLDSIRHVGDLGNIKSDSSGVAKVSIQDGVISLNGPNRIVGRTVVVHTGVDDLGRGDSEDSKKTGNAGGRAACGVIGIVQ